MQVAVLFSGGKDSSLAGLMLSHLLDVELITVSFGVCDAWVHARDSARALGMSHRVVNLPSDVVEEAAQMCLEDGYPNRAIQHIHVRSIELLSSLGVTRIADGTRRDDRVPKLTISEARSLEDRLGIQYMCPLWGIGSSTINELARTLFELEQGESPQVRKADYEVELRAMVEEMGGPSAVRRIFPQQHVQSHVIGMRKGGIE